MGVKCSKPSMGLKISKGSQQGINGPGCVRDMYKKHGYECADERLLCKWHRWTAGVFPQTGTFSVEKLRVSREIMELKAKPFRPELFDLWEREAKSRQSREKEGKKTQCRKGPTDTDERETPGAVGRIEAEVFVQHRHVLDSPVIPKRKPPNYDEHWTPATLYPPLPMASPMQVPQPLPSPPPLPTAQPTSTLPPLPIAQAMPTQQLMPIAQVMPPPPMSIAQPVQMQQPSMQPTQLTVQPLPPTFAAPVAPPPFPSPLSSPPPLSQTALASPTAAMLPSYAHTPGAETAIISPQLPKPTTVIHSPALAPRFQAPDRLFRQHRGEGVEMLTYDRMGEPVFHKKTLFGSDDSDSASSSADVPTSKPVVQSFPIIQIPGHAGQLVHVARPWLPEEMKSVATAMPKPEEGTEAFIEAVKRMDRIYRPTTAEMAAILSKKCLPHWLQLREKLPLDIDRTSPAVVAMQGVPAQASGEDRFQNALNDVFTEIRNCYTATEDWTKMAINQATKETVREFFGRVSMAVTKHSGGTTTPAQKESLIRQYFILGGKKDVTDYIKNHLVTWSIAPPNELLQYAENFERIMEKSEQKKQDDFQQAALSFYQSSVQDKERNHRKNGNNGRKDYNNGRNDYNNGRNGGNDKRSDACYQCGQTGHWSKECPRCGACGQKGHHAYACKQQKNGSSNGHRQRGPVWSQNGNHA